MPTAPILIVDRDPEDLHAMRRILADEHCLVFAWSGEGALAAVRRHQPALVLLGLELPELDGLAVCRRLKADAATAAIPVILVAGRDGAPDAGGDREGAGFEAGAADYIVKPVSPAGLRARVRTHLSLVQQARLEMSYREAVFMLGKASHFRDDETGVHPWRMAAYAAALAEAAGWDAERCRLMELAAALHDVGKLGVPDAVVLKPLKLDAGEWDVMKTHCRIGHEILVVSSAPVFQLGAAIALHHHERWDGSGYPDRLAGEAIPEAARITAVADVFDALTVKRPYRDAWPVSAAMATLRMAAGSHFDPRLVALFESILPRIVEIKAQWDARVTPQP